MSVPIKVSVIIPTHNAEKYILETVRSVLNQKFKEWELIIVNDGSTDNTPTILKEFESNSQISIFTIENSGVSHARNVGFERSKGEFIAFLDADDVWMEDNLDEKVKLLSDNLDVGLVHSDCEVIDGNGNSIGEVKRGKSGKILNDLLLWEETCIPAPSSILVRRALLEGVGLFNENLSTAADQEFFFRAASKFRIGRVSKITWKYRVHENNMHQNIRRMEHDHIMAYKIAESLGLFKSKSFRNKCFSNLYMILAGSWWVNKNKNPRTFIFLWKSLVSDPFNFFKKLLYKIN